MDPTRSCRPRDRGMIRDFTYFASGLELTCRRASASSDSRSIRALVVLATCCWLLTIGSAAAEVDSWQDTLKGLHPYVGVAITDDSNLLRQSDSIPGHKSDKYTTLEAGFESKVDVSRQRFLFDGRIYRNQYDRFDQYDHTAGNARLLWKWARGNLWEGDLGYSYSRKLRDFANQTLVDGDGNLNVLLPKKDLIDRHNVYASANRWLTPRWRAGARLDWADVSSSESESLDKRRTGGGVALDWVSEAGNSLGFETLYMDTAFRSASDRDYEDWYSGLTGHWEVTSKTLFDARTGYQQRQYDKFSAGDYDGLVGRLDMTWLATEKTSVAASAWREISNLQDEISNYAVIDAVELEPTWRITEKLALRGAARYEKRDFKGTGSIVEELSDRDDDVYAYAAWLDWQFLRNGILSVGYETERRTSNRELKDYDYDAVRATLRIGL